MLRLGAPLWFNGYAAKGIMLPRTEFEMSENIRDFMLAFSGDRLVGCVGDGARLREAGPCTAERHLEAEPIARHDLPPELRIVHTAKPHTGGTRCTGLLEQEHLVPPLPV